MPGSQIQIFDMQQSGDFHIDVALIFPWNIADEIKEKIRANNPQSRIFSLIPRLKELT